ncbi:hypothetical protein DSUL_50227 [Desulfovibrionales bacterium]
MQNNAIKINAQSIKGHYHALHLVAALPTHHNRYHTPWIRPRPLKC